VPALLAGRKRIFVEVHGVRLPVEFIETMRRHLWEPPKREIRLRSSDEVYDISFWRAWTAGQSSPAA